MPRTVAQVRYRDGLAIGQSDRAGLGPGVRVVRATAAIDFGAIGAGTGGAAIVVPGAELGGSVSISPDQDLPNGLMIAWARVPPPGGVMRFGVRNVSGSTMNPAAITSCVSDINPRPASLSLRNDCRPRTKALLIDYRFTMSVRHRSREFDPSRAA